MNKIIENRKFFMKFRRIDDGFAQNFDVKLSELGKYITQPRSFWVKALDRNGSDIELKDKDKCMGFWFNQHKNGCYRHTKDDFDIPLISWVDIDFKPKSKQENDFKNDLGDKQAVIDRLKEDENIFLVGESLGGGIRIAAVVKNDYIGQILDSEDSDELHKLNLDYFLNYLGYIHGIRPTGSYVDECSKRITQPSYSLKNCYINNECKSLYHDYKIPPKTKKVCVNLQYPNINKDNIFAYEKAINIADNNSKYIKQIYNNRDFGKHIIFSTFTPDLIAIIKFSDKEAQKIWYDLLVKNYRGDSLRSYLNTYDTFIKYLDISKSLKFAQRLEYLLK